MRLLLDECVPKRLRRQFVPHSCEAATEAGFSGIPNGELLVAAEKAGFDVLITVDRGISRQNNFVGRKISLITLRSFTGSYRELQKLIPQCLGVLDTLTPGTTVEIGPQ